MDFRGIGEADVHDDARPPAAWNPQAHTSTSMFRFRIQDHE